MGVRTTHEEGKVALFDSTTGEAFGRVFESQDEADDFLGWYEALRSADGLGHLTELMLDEVYDRQFEWARERLDEDGELREAVAAGDDL
jgi:hypothetical protein